MSNLSDRIEAVLFVSSEPLSRNQLADVLAVDGDELGAAIDELRSRLKQGIRLAETNGQFALISAPECASDVTKFLQSQAKIDLSKPALETLAVIAYKQPITKPDIDELRGVSSDQSIKNLLLRGLIAEAGSDKLGNRRYTTSLALLESLGITSLEELPPLPEGDDAS